MVGKKPSRAKQRKLRGGRKKREIEAENERENPCKQTSSKSHKNYPKCLFKRANVSDYRVGVHPVLCSALCGS